ncbi:MAG: DNA primase [Candidatus Tectimicrobiota bacterium]|nr:MAG: DNA primase [Candidatus Tectomicrobia bacterium]
MAHRIPETVVEEVLRRADIVAVVGEYVRLRKSGASYKGLCPFHQEKTPSFTVSPDKGLFYCFGCQAGGNVVHFVMRREGLSFPEAVRHLAARYGVPLADTAAPPDRFEPFYRLHRAAVAFFQKCLQEAIGQPARAYCRQRQLSPESIARFELGYAPASWDALSRELQRQGFARELLVASGLAAMRSDGRGCYDRFRHRLIFPIHDRYGRPVAFGGRALETGGEAPAVPKYLNSPETPIFHKGRLLYGFHLAKAAIRQRGLAILVEGYTDVIACHSHGIANVVGTLGTALTEEQVRLLKGLASEVVLVFDSDAAGGAATERGLALLLDAGLRVRVAVLPAGEDPDSCLRRYGAEAFVRRVEAAESFVAYLVGRGRAQPAFDTPAGRADWIARIVPLLRKVPSPVERWGYLVELADKSGVPVAVLQREVGLDAAPAGPPLAPPPRVPAAGRPAEEYTLVRLLCHKPRLLQEVRERVCPEDFRDPLLRALYALLLRLAPQGEEAVFATLLRHAETPAQEQLLAQMAVEPLEAEAAEIARALADCMAKFQQRRLQAKRQQLKAQIQEAERRGVPVADSLLRAYHELSRELHSGFS